MTRKTSSMVNENDPQWLRFWAAYPHRVSKKDARVAWAELNPGVELVERMLSALEWQARLWAVQGYGVPYPATWLRGERWEDERPTNGKAHAAAPGYDATARCPHTPKCINPWDCSAYNKRVNG